MIVRLVIFAVCASLTAFVAQIFFGGAIFAAAQQETFQIVLRDHYSKAKETHELSGMVMVPSDCADVSVRVKDYDASTTFLIFETWEQPYRINCEKAPTPRAVHASVFAPKDVEFRALLDNEIVPKSLVPAII